MLLKLFRDTATCHAAAVAMSSGPRGSLIVAGAVAASASRAPASRSQPDIYEAADPDPGRQDCYGGTA